MPKARLTVAALPNASTFRGLVADGDGTGAVLTPETAWNADDVVTGISNLDVKQLESLYVGTSRAFERLARYSGAVRTDAPVAYYRLDTDPTAGAAVDSSGLGAPTSKSGYATGTLAASPLAEDGNGAWLAGVSTTYDLNFGDVFGFAGTANFSVDLWYKPFAIGSVVTLVSKTDSVAATQTGWALVQAGSGGIVMQRRSGGVQSSAPTSATMSAGTWYHIGASYDGSTNQTRLYVNGILNANVVHTAVPAIGATAQPFRIGGVNTSSSMSSNPQSTFAEVAVYDHILSDERFHAHWASGKYGYS